jgi:thiol-disulfide isomerase/thioredoxin/uncharacterized protein YjgD (DUF1641 family)
MKKKNLLASAVMLCLCLPAMAQKTANVFSLSGNINGADSVIIYYQGLSGKMVNVARPIINKKFLISGKINAPCSASVMFKNKGEVIDQQQFWERRKEIYLEPSKMTISGKAADLKNLKITGSLSQAELEDLDRQTDEIRKEMEPITEALKLEKDHEKASEIRDQLEPYNDRIKKITYDFFIAHPNSPVTVNMMRFYISRMRLDSAKRVYNNFNSSLKKRAEVKDIAKEIARIEKGIPGSIAAGFSAKDINGKMLSLSDFKGKYVIIDFWASWCVPCRKGNPHLIKLFNTYKEKGLDVIGISDDDRNHDAWKKAVNQDQIGIWHHVLRGLDMDLRMKNLPNPADISEKYGISSLPTKILIDPAGKIVGRYGDNNGGSDEDLDKKLAQIFNK